MGSGGKRVTTAPCCAPSSCGSHAPGASSALGGPSASGSSCGAPASCLAASSMLSCSSAGMAFTCDTTSATILDTLGIEPRRSCLVPSIFPSMFLSLVRPPCAAAFSSARYVMWAFSCSSLPPSSAVATALLSDSACGCLDGCGGSDSDDSDDGGSDTITYTLLFTTKSSRASSSFLAFLFG